MQKQLKIEYKIIKKSRIIFIVLLLIALAVDIVLPNLVTDINYNFEYSIGMVIGYVASVMCFMMTVWAVDIVIELGMIRYLNFINALKLAIYFGLFALSVYNIHISMWSIFAGLLIIKIATYMTKEVGEY